MAIKIVREQRKNENGTYDIIHPETQAKVVWMSDGRSVEEATENKQDKLTGSAGQVVGFDENGNVVTQEMPNEIVVSDTAPTDEDVEVWINTGDDDGLDFVSGSSNAPDLVIGLEMPSSVILHHDNIDAIRNGLFIKRGSVADTYAKLVSRKEVKVVLEHEYYYGDSNRFVGLFYPVIVSTAAGDVAQLLLLSFMVSSALGYPMEQLDIRYDTDGNLNGVDIRIIQ